jgi:hypothetical protein
MIELLIAGAIITAGTSMELPHPPPNVRVVTSVETVCVSGYQWFLIKEKDGSTKLLPIYEYRNGHETPKPCPKEVK